MNSLILLIGGNLGDVKKTFDEVKSDISKQIGSIFRQSYIYSSPSWGYDSKNLFLNQALVIKTILDVDEIFIIIQKIEISYGRKKTLKYKDRFIDIDIIFFNQEIIKTKNLIIPHIHMHKRAFVLLPLCDVIPNYIHPVLGLNISNLNNKIDNSKVIKYVV